MGEKALGLSDIAVSPGSIGKQEGAATQNLKPADPVKPAVPAKLKVVARALEQACEAVAAAAPVRAAVMATEAFGKPALSTQEKRVRLDQMDQSEVRVCRACRLCGGRTQTVFGEGDVDARLMFIGEGPGENEDLTGRPFVGRAGELLGKQIAAMGLSRDRVYICNVVKCRPPENRTPLPDEMSSCAGYLLRQIEWVRPAVIITLGLPATQFLFQTKAPLASMRGRWHVWRGIDVMPTYHPSYVLRRYTDDVRKMVWDDLQQVMARLGLKKS